MKYYILFSFLPASFQFGCFHDTKTYDVNIKIYLDQYSREKLSEFVVKELENDENNNKDKNYSNEKKLKDLKENTIAYQNPFIEHYFAEIFNNVNASLVETNVQVRADFSELFSLDAEKIYAKHCRDFQNIQDITAGFLQDIGNENENKIFISNCYDKMEFLPQRSHFAAKNECGKVHGILYGDPKHMSHTIEAGIFEMFHSKSIPQIEEETVARNADVCRYSDYCSKDFPGNGTFKKEMGVYYHTPLIEIKSSHSRHKKEEAPKNAHFRLLYSNFVGSRSSHIEDKKFHDTCRYSYDLYDNIIRKHMANDHSVLNHDGRLLLEDSPVIEKQQIVDHSGKILFDTGNRLIEHPHENFIPDSDHDLSKHHLNFNQRSFLNHLKNTSDSHNLTHNDHIGSYVNRNGVHGMKFHNLFHHHNLSPAAIHASDNHNPLTYDYHLNDPGIQNDSPLINQRQESNPFIDHHDYKDEIVKGSDFNGHLLVH